MKKSFKYVSAAAVAALFSLPLAFQANAVQNTEIGATLCDPLNAEANSENVLHP